MKNTSVHKRGGGKHSNPQGNEEKNIGGNGKNNNQKEILHTKTNSKETTPKSKFNNNQSSTMKQEPKLKDKLWLYIFYIVRLIAILVVFTILQRLTTKYILNPYILHRPSPHYQCPPGVDCSHYLQHLQPK